MSHGDPQATLTEHDGGAEEDAPPRRGLFVLESPDSDIRGNWLETEPALTLGRAVKAARARSVRDPLLSRKHVTIRRRGSLQVYEVRDEASKNGTWVGGKRISHVTVKDGDIVRVGGTLMMFGPLPPDLDADEDTGGLLGQSVAMRKLRADIDRVAATKLHVLVQGETGTGKELVARRLHHKSERSGDHIAVNCAAIPKDLAEAYLFGHRKGAFTGATQDTEGSLTKADGGTLFLDEVGEMPAELQPKLLRVLETSDFTPVGETTPVHCDVRVVAATHVDLREAVESGRFRQDLYARLAGYVLEVPPLRDRRVDIPDLLRHFLTGTGVFPSVALLEAAVLHAWPMNVRELRSFSQRLAVDSDEKAAKASLMPAGGGRAGGTSKAPTRDELVELLEKHSGSVARIAEHFGKDRRQVYRWLERHRLEADSYR